MTDVESVGGKNASLGEMLSQLESAGIRVPDGFATTADAFRDFLDAGRSAPADRAGALNALDVDDVRALAEDRSRDSQAGSSRRRFRPDLKTEIRIHYQKLID